MCPPCANKVIIFPLTDKKKCFLPPYSLTCPHKYLSAMTVFVILSGNSFPRQDSATTVPQGWAGRAFFCVFFVLFCFGNLCSFVPQTSHLCEVRDILPHTTFWGNFSCESVCIGATVADNWSEISQNGSNGPKMKMSLLLKGSQHLRGGGVDCSWSSFGPVWLVETLVDPPGGTLTGLSSEKKMCFQWLAWSAENFLTPKTGQKRPILAIFGFFATKAAKKTPQKFISTSACSTKRKFSSNQVDPWTPDWRRGLYLASGFFPMSTASHWTLTHDFSNNLVFANCINIRDFSEILHISAKYQRQSQSFIFLYIL